ncbi:MAG: hypothetical protein IJ733_08505 [Lachnospiraceae bacterium]|nr:hypothetical protein [Lachnospiraceae bacterium]
MCVTVNIEKGAARFELVLNSQNTKVADNDTEGRGTFISVIERLTTAVKVNTSNGFGVELLDLSKFDSRLTLCLNSIQRKYFSLSDEGAAKFHFFKKSEEPKDQERYQRMLSNYWKEQIDNKNASEGGQIIFVDADEFVETAEFKALLKTDKVNYYVILAKENAAAMQKGEETIYEFEAVEDKWVLKAVE